MFHILEREMQWRRDNGRPEGFGSLRAHRPILAVGAEDPLEDQKMLADYFRMHFFLTAKELTLIWNCRRDRWSWGNPCHCMFYPHLNKLRI